MMPNNPVVGGVALRRPAIQSPNFVSGVSGWSIDQDGNAEFNSIVIPPGSGGSTTFVQGTTPTALHVNDLWVNTANGNSIYSWNGSAWVQYQFGSGSIQAGSITAALIAANTITAAQLAAGIVYAGIVDATTISGAVFKGTNWIENSTGSFFYSGTPAANLLIQSESNTQGQDSFGNYFLSGNTVYIPAGGGGFIAVQNAAGAINFWFASVMVSVSNPWTALGNIAPFNGSPNVLQVTPGPNTGDYIGFAGPVKVTGGFHYSGPIVAYAPSTTTDETWHTLGALGAGSGYTVNNARYQRVPNGETEIDINLTAGAATVAGVYVFANALPGAYRPLLNYSYPMGWNGTVTAGMNFPSLRPVAATGLVNLQLPALPNGTVISCTQRIPVN